MKCNVAFVFGNFFTRPEETSIINEVQLKNFLDAISLEIQNVLFFSFFFFFFEKNNINSMELFIIYIV